MAEITKKREKLNDWRGTIIPALPGIFRQRKLQGRANLTLRGLYYLLWKGGLIKKSRAEMEAELAAAEKGEKQAGKDTLYTMLGNNVADARFDPAYNPRYAIPLDALRDDSKPESEDPPFRTAAKEAQLTKRYISRDTWREFYTIAIWNGQTNYVEVLFEKATIFEDIDQIVNDELGWQVKVSAAGGNAGGTRLHDLYLRLWYQQYVHKKKVYARYLGDYDAYGWDMDRDIRKRLWEIKTRYMVKQEKVKVDLGDGKYEMVVPILDLHNGEKDEETGLPITDEIDLKEDFRTYGITDGPSRDDPTHVFQRIAITKEQIEQWGLTKIEPRRVPDRDMDANSQWAKRYPAEWHFAIMNDGWLFNVEIDDAVASNWEQLSQLLDGTIRGKYDQAKAEAAKDENSEKRFDKEMEKMLDEFVEEWKKDKAKRQQQQKKHKRGGGRIGGGR
jgi:hypothetical protein